MSVSDNSKPTDSTEELDSNYQCDNSYDSMSISNFSDDYFSKSSINSESEDETLPNFDELDSMFKVDYNGVTIFGEGMPPIENIKISFREAWRICKQGCLCIRRNFWDPKGFTVTFYAVCDGTDPVNFLVLHPVRKESKPIVISLWEILRAYWVWKKCRLFYIPNGASKSRSGALVIDGLSPIFYEALLKCVYECKLMIDSTQNKLDELNTT